MPSEEETNNPEVQAEEQEQAQTSDVEESQAPSTEQEQGTGEEDKQPEADLSAEEGEEAAPFTDKVDPNKLSPELQKVYKNMQADYTRKTQEIKSIMPKYQEAEQARQVLQQLWADPEFQKWRATETERRQQAQQEPDYDNMTEEDRYKHYEEKIKSLEDRLNQSQQTYGTFIKQAQMEKAQKTINDFRAKHPEAKEEELARLAPVIRQHGINLEQAYTLTYPDRFKQQAVDKARSELQAKKKANLETGGGTQASPQIPDKPSLDQALAMAKKEHGYK